MTVVLETPFVADEEPGGEAVVEVEEPGGEAVAGDSVKGTLASGGLLEGELDGDVGDILGAFFGDCAGEGEETGVGVEGDALGGGVVGEEGGGVEGVAGGGAEGVADGGEDVASVSTSSFIPWLQCPAVPQMKYLLPVEERVMTVLPPL